MLSLSPDSTRIHIQRIGQHRRRAHITTELATMEDYQKKNYATILTSHNVPEGQAAIAQKISYLKKLQSLANTCPKDYVASD